MKKKTAIKIILGTIFFSFVLFFSQFIFPIQASAVSDNTGLNWSNPNANGDNPYKLTTDAILNSQTMMQVVGCTGIVNAVTGAITGFLQDKASSIVKTLFQTKKEAAIAKACAAAKAAPVTVASTADIAGTNVTPAVVETIKCPSIQKTTDTAQTAATTQTNTLLSAAQKRDDCFNGLAYTLAKNQLTSMTKETVNWINSGFNGNPMYVQNMTSLTNSIEKNVIGSGIAVLANGAFPYGNDFNTTLVKSYNSGALNGAEKFLNNLTSDLSAFLVDNASSGIAGLITPTTSLTALQKAQQANNRFANDFSVGGWDGYMALTQRDQNNPLGFAMDAAQSIADRINQQATQTKDEVSQNNGFLSQKECTNWQLYDKTGKALTTNNTLIASSTTPSGISMPSLTSAVFIYSPNKSGTTPNFDQCVSWKVITPGSIIKDKLTTYINSPERQLELADTINKSLSSLFTKLIENFRSEGLLGLSQEKYSAIDNMGGYGVNGTTTDSNIGTGYSSPSSFVNGSTYDSSSFDLTRDLGNTYIHDDVKKIGDWNAATNSPQLNVALGPYDATEKGYYSPNYYYTVTVAGDTKLFNNGYNGWAVGDRAFWDGTAWQDWKCGLPLKKVTDPITKEVTMECPNQPSPIKTRGIVQIQQDYIIAAKEILKMLPGIMPKLGELDYCIPGPNPSFETNTTDTSTAFNDYAGTLVGTFDNGSFFVANSTKYSISKQSTRGDTKYDIYANIFKDTPTLFTSVRATEPWMSLNNFDGKTYSKNGDETRAQDAVLDLLQQIQSDITTFYTNYTTDILDGVYGTMRSQYNEKEETSALFKNSAYVPMIEDGYAMTKDIVQQSEDIATQTQDYNDAIIQAESNIGKLNIIKNQVSQIIQAAQKRRDADPSFNNALLAYYPGKTLAEAEALYAQYKIDNKACFDEEDISYYDVGDLTVDNSTEAGRCSDGLDNDLDGLIDAKDPDCHVDGDLNKPLLPNP